MTADSCCPPLGSALYSIAQLELAHRWLFFVIVATKWLSCYNADGYKPQRILQCNAVVRLEGWGQPTVVSCSLL